MSYRKKVMIVDDNRIDQLITAYILKLNKDTEEVIVMPSASEALEYLAVHSTNLEALPHLIFLDLDMPVMNGFDFLARFKEYADDVKSFCRIVVVTASEIKADLDRMKADPHVIKLVTKPLDRHSLVL